MARRKDTCETAGPRKTERSAVAVIMSWMREIIQEHQLPLGLVDVDTTGPDGKSPDLIIYEAPRSQSILVVGEFKPPYYDAFDETELKEPARQKASRRQAKYFVTSNLKQLVWYSTEQCNRQAPEAEQVLNVYRLSDLPNTQLLEEPRFRILIKAGLSSFLSDLCRVHFDRQPEPRLPLDLLLIHRIRALVQVLSQLYHAVVAEKVRKDTRFAGQLAAWFNSQQWSFHHSESDYERVARQAAYLLANKILFYHVLQFRRPLDLDPIHLADTLSKPAVLRSTLQGFFDDVVRDIDYETIYSTDFIDELAFPDNSEVVRWVRELCRLFARYDLGRLGYDVIGPVFEQLIPAEERHVFGQYFTNSEVTDLILAFAIRRKDDVVLDPACGAGTFLVRAYQYKKWLDPRLHHKELLGALWGVDIAKFPAHLSMINLALNDLAVDENYPNILQHDFFAYPFAGNGSIRQLSGRIKTIAVPEQLDAIVGNPPYTRQEELEQLGGQPEYKVFLRKSIGDGSAGNSEELSLRAGIHAYFFIHGTKFLKPGGRFAFVVSDTWLDADFGMGLKSFLLGNYRVMAVIASKVERWFADAKINTCIVLLEKDLNADKRAKNCTRFIQLKKSLREFLPPGGDPAREQTRFKAVQETRDFLLNKTATYEDDDVRITVIPQCGLTSRGKWGFHLRAPQELSALLKNKSPRIILLSKLATPYFGIKTGADPWFYVKDITEGQEKELRRRARSRKYRGRFADLRLILSGDGTRWPIERKYLSRVVRNPDEYRAICIPARKVNDWAVVLPPQPKKHFAKELVSHYIAHGEKKMYAMGKGESRIPARTKTCASRPYWYSLANIPRTRLLWQKACDISFRHYLADKAILANQRFYPLAPRKGVPEEYLAGYLNSAFAAAWLEVQRAAMGEGAIEATVDEVKAVPLIDPRGLSAKVVREVEEALRSLAARPIGTIFEEYGASNPKEVTWERIPPDRARLERAVLGGALGLQEEEQLCFIAGLVDLTRSRREKAASLAPPEAAENAFLRCFAEGILHGAALDDRQTDS